MPTVMDLCGIDLQRYSKLNFHGKSLKPLLVDPDHDWQDRTIVTDSQRLPYPVKWRQSAVMSQQWRLINGCELYDIIQDRGQTHDLSDQHPDIVNQLRSAYEQWWEIVSIKFDDDIPITIGHPDEPVTCLTAHDWRDPNHVPGSDPFVKESNDYLVYNQAHIRKGLGQNGYFEIHVQQHGCYQFELQRWPREEPATMTKGIAHSDDGWRKDVIHPRHYDEYSGGIAIAFTTAGIRIGNHEQTKRIEPKSHAAIFNLELESGDYHLTTWLRTDEGLERGAYYVYVSLMDQ